MSAPNTHQRLSLAHHRPPSNELLQFSECRGVAQPGSASALGAEGRGFESLRPDHQIRSATNHYWLLRRILPRRMLSDRNEGDLFRRLILQVQVLLQSRSCRKHVVKEAAVDPPDFIYVLHVAHIDGG